MSGNQQARQIYARQNIGHPCGFGERPALLVVDFVNGFNDPDVLGGGNIAASIAATKILLDAARAARLPVAFTRIVYTAATPGVFCLKMPALAELAADNPRSQIVPELSVGPYDHVVCKTQPSAFFGTDLASWLIGHRVDTVLVAGCTTSGCVRASVVDAMSFNFRPIVVAECVGDRAIEPHEASLFDIAQKYGDVLPLADVLAHLDGLTSTP
jgi:maleamate amidohydrolase